MREYKTRGKAINNGGWVYGYYVYTFEIGYSSQGFTDVPPRKHYIFGDSDDFCEVDPETVGQYTGLPDRNGKEIYEGDISYAEHGNFATNYLILWDESKAQYIAKIIKTNSVLTKNASFPLWQYVEDNGECRFEVIGNRWVIPSLLEAK